MSYLVLARKYRPQTFDAVIRQDHITRTLTNAIQMDRVAHAILFSGPRGTGKTTVARILAKAMNCADGPTPSPCNACRSCQEITQGRAADVYEIDGASNNSVDQIRELRENIKYMPSFSPRKIYIVDEVHMLSTAAFNALLKTLEEPPAHVMFLFATTEPQKIPITILSRCQRHDFRRIGSDAICRHLSDLCSRESVGIDDESLALIAREAGGSMRDALSLLDQVISGGQGAVDYEQVRDLLGAVDRQALSDLAQGIIDGDPSRTLELLADLYERGTDLRKLHGDLLGFFRHLVVISGGDHMARLVDLPAGEIAHLKHQTAGVSSTLLRQLFDGIYQQSNAVRLSDNPRLVLEMMLMRLQQVRPTLPIALLIEKLDALRQEIQTVDGARTVLAEPGCLEPVSAPPAAPSTGVGPSDEGPAATGGAPPVSEPAAGPGDEFAQPGHTWQAIEQRLLDRHPSLAANLAGATIDRLDSDRVTVRLAGSDFDFKRVNRPKSLEALASICSEVLQRTVAVEVVARHGDETMPRRTSEPDQKRKQRALRHPLVEQAVELFKGEVVDVKIFDPKGGSQ
jgi:DNA polymerase-3 subunit gamma/tau